MTNEGKLAIKLAQDNGFDLKAYSSEQATLIQESIKAMNAGYIDSAFIVENLLDPEYSEDKIAHYYEKLYNFVENIKKIESLFGKEAKETFIKGGIERHNTRFINTVSRFILDNTVFTNSDLSWLERATVVNTFYKEGIEKAIIQAEEIARARNR